MSAPSEKFKSALREALGDCGEDWDWVDDADWLEIQEVLKKRTRMVSKAALRLTGLYGNAVRAVAALPSHLRGGEDA